MKTGIYICITCLILTFGGMLSSQAAVNDDGLILYFGFEKETNGMVTDETGGGNDGTLSAGATLSNEEKAHGSRSLKILDQNESFQVNSFAELAAYQDNSFLFWINFIQGSNGNWSQIIAKYAPNINRAPGIWVRPNELGIHYRFEPGNAGPDYVGPNGNNTQFETQKWYHIAGVKQGAQLTFYVDGVSKGQYNVPANHTKGADKLYVGKSPVYRAATFYFDELYIYNRALTEAEVTEIKDGQLLPVEPKDKLTTTWGKLKTR